MYTESWLDLVFLRSQLTNFIISNPEFCFGFIAGLMFAFMVGYVSQRIILFFGPVLAFFRPTRNPMTQAGPSPANVFSGCLRRLIYVGLLTVVLFVLFNAFT